MNNDTSSIVLAVIEAALAAALDKVWTLQAETESAPTVGATPTPGVLFDTPATRQALPQRKPRQIITPQMVMEMMDAWNQKAALPEHERLRALAQQYNLSRSAVQNVIEGRHKFSPTLAVQRTKENGEFRRHVTTPDEVKRIEAMLGGIKHPGAGNFMRIAATFGVSAKTVRDVFHGRHRYSTLPKQS